MQKEKKIRTYTRKTKTGKTVTVKAHTAKYDAAEEARKVFAKKAGAGEELSMAKKEKVVPAANDDLGFSAEDYKAWYHWDTEGDPKNAQALKVKKALIAKMGRSAYNKYEQQMTDSYSARGHLKGFKGVGDLKSQEQVAREKTRARRIKEAEARQHQEDREKFGAGGSTLVAHVNGDYSNRYAVKRLSPMVKDEKFTKKVEGDAYSDFFPKGGSYEFFYGKTRDGRVGLYAKNGRSIIELEETEPSKSLMKQLGAKPSETPKGMSPVKAGNATLFVDNKNVVFRKKRDGSLVPETSEGAIDQALRNHLGVSQSELSAMRKRGELSTLSKKKAIGKVEQVTENPKRAESRKFRK